MNKQIKFAIGALLAPGMVLASTWIGTTGDWADAANWDTAVPGAADPTHINAGAVAQASVTTPGALSAQLVMENGSGLTIAAGGDLAVGGQALLGNAPSSLGSTITLDGGQLSVAAEFAFGVTGGGILDINSGTVNANGPWLMAGYLGGSIGDITLDGGALNTLGPLYVGFDGDGSLTVNDGTVSLGSHLIVGANAGSIGDIEINGGSVTAQALNFGGGGMQTLDLNGGQLINNGGFAASPGSTFYIGSGELIFTPASGASLEDVEDLVSQPNWIFDDTALVYDSGSGIVVTSIPEPATIGLIAIFGGALMGIRRFRI